MPSRGVRGRRLIGLLAIGTTMVLALGSVPGTASAVPPPSSATQLLTVETASPGATTGTLRAWERAGGSWRLVLGPYPVYVGASGVGAAQEGSAMTPGGTFPLTEAFGRQPNPGTAMPYFQADTYDWWDGNVNSPTYNTHVRQQSSPGGASENLYNTGAVYDYAVNIGYNLQRTPGAGSAIFLHVANGQPTAACVSMDRNALIAVLRWLRPAAQPHIMINVARVQNAIGDAWYRLGGAGGPLGLPTGDERGVGDGRGAFQYFQAGGVYWTGSTGAHAVVNGNLQAWARQGYERGPLGYPTTDELATGDGRGAFNYFERGSVYWSAATGAHYQVNAISDVWVRQGYETGPLGYPTTDELATADRRGAFNYYQRGSIYWSAATGAHSMVNAISDVWVNQGYETGPLGYPTTDERATADGRGAYNLFQGGAAYWSAATGAHYLTGAIYRTWAARGSETGPLGYPTTNPYAVPGGTRVDFQGGSLTQDDAGTVR